MKHAALLTLLGSLFVLGCASSGQKTTATATADRPSRHHHAKSKEVSFDSSSGASQMGMDNESGVYETSDIEETMSGHMDEVRVCLRKAGHPHRSSVGKVTLQFQVDGQGSTTNVQVVATDLGNNQLEQCLVDMGRRIKFPPPLGNKGATFEYPVEFRSRRA